VKYHGGDDGWTDLVAKAKRRVRRCGGLHDKPAPTPRIMAAIWSIQDPTRWTSPSGLILTVASRKMLTRFFNAIKGKAVQLAAQK